MITTATAALVAVVTGLLTYLFLCWFRDPLRRVPGPVPLPLIGNALMLKPNRMHSQLYDWAGKYGPVMKFSIFHQPFVVLNSLEVCLEAKLNRGDGFLGRPPLPRFRHIVKTDMGFTGYDNPAYPVLRRVATSGLRAYGTGMADLERVIQEVLQDMVEELNTKSGQPINSGQLCNGFVGKVIVYLLYGERDTSLDESVFQSTHEMNERMMTLLNPANNDSILDIFPVFMQLMPYFFRKTHKYLEETKIMVEHHIYSQITAAKEAFDEENMRGVLDYFIKQQKEELDSDGKPLISDESLLGLVFDFVGGGMETSFTSLCQAFLDFVHDKALVKRIQAEIDVNFESGHVIKPSDRSKLPYLEAYIHENLRVLSQAPFLVPSQTICDTEVGGYKIPNGTRVLFNAYNTAHNPNIYPKPFDCKPERFLDDEGNIVPPGHPVRQNYIGFGVGKRHCIAESFARTRIFLFLAHLLQKFDIEAVGKLPERDVRNYEMGIALTPPVVDVKFTLRTCVE